MDTYRTSQVYNTQNQSHLSNEVVQSNLESVIQYQNSQMSMMKVINMLIILLSAIVIIVLGIFTLRPSVRTDNCPTDLSQYSFTEKIRYRMLGITPECISSNPNQNNQNKGENDDPIWNMVKPSGDSKEDRQLGEKLKNQKFTVQGYLPVIPEYEQIRKNRDQYNLSNELNQSCFDGGNQLECQTYKSVKATLNNIFQVQLDQNSTADDFDGVKKELEGQTDLYNETNKLMDRKFIFDVQYTANDLVNSQKNYVKKKARLNNVQAVFFEKMKQLEGISSELTTAKQRIDEEKTKNSTFDSRLSDAELNIKKLVDEINERKNQLTKKEQDQIEHLERLNSAVGSLEAELADKDKIMSEIKMHQGKIVKNQAIIDDNKNTLKKLNDDLTELLNRQQSNTVKNTEFNKKQGALEHQKKLHTISLDVLLKNKEIKEYLDGLIDQEKDINDLNSLMGVKIEKETSLLEQVNEYNKASDEFDKLEGEVVVDESRDHSKEIQSKIDKDKEELAKITEKYTELKDTLSKYQTSEIEINNLRVKIADVDKKLEDLEKEKKAYFKQDYNIQDRIDSLRNKIKGIEDQIEALRNDIAFSTEFIQTKTTWLEDKQQQLAKAFEERNTYKAQYDRENAEINKVFEDLNKQLNEARKNKQNLIDEKNAFVATIRRMESEMKEKADDCVNLKLYLQEMEKLMPVS